MELDDLARRLDHQPVFKKLRDDLVSPRRDSAGSSPDRDFLIQAIEELPKEEREVFGLVKIQALSHAEAADVLGVATKTVQRRLHRAMLLLRDLS